MTVPDLQYIKTFHSNMYLIYNVVDLGKYEAGVFMNILLVLILYVVADL